jgi:predicted sugar kinase
MNTFTVGTILNPIKSKLVSPTPVFEKLTLQYPSRLNAMALDPSRIDVNRSGVYSPGEVIYSIALYKIVNINLRRDCEIVISELSPRHQLIRHAALLMKDALHLKQGFNISVEVEDLRHCGLGSSSGLISAVAAAINEMYGNPIPKLELIAYLAQNHGEEIDGSISDLQHVQCIGGSAASGLIESGMTVLTGESTPIGTMLIDTSYTVLIGVPNDYVAADSKELMRLEMLNMDKFIATGNHYRDRIGYRVVHEMLPQMKRGNLREASRLIFDYRFDYGSIDNCSFVYPNMKRIAKNIRFLFEDGTVDVLALSSVGPAFFAITKKPNLCESVFQDNNLFVRKTKINNSGYTIINRVLI